MSVPPKHNSRAELERSERDDPFEFDEFYKPHYSAREVASMMDALWAESWPWYAPGSVAESVDPTAHRLVYLNIVQKKLNRIETYLNRVMRHDAVDLSRYDLMSSAVLKPFFWKRIEIVCGQYVPLWLKSPFNI